MSHPARFSTPIVEVIREFLLAEYPNWMGRPIIHDPFAGTGERLRELCGADFAYSGTELEECFIVADGIICGNAKDPTTYPPARFPNEVITGGWVVCTSPVYANGMADHHKPRDASKRHMYRAAKIQITGDPDAELHPDNMGRYGYRSTKRDGKSTKREAFWKIADESMAHWDSALLVIVNVSDFIARGQIEPHVDDWKQLLRKHGWINQTDIPVGTQRQRNGENGELRADHEVIIIGRRA